jgi:hypothetical protein
MNSLTRRNFLTRAGAGLGATLAGPGVASATTLTSPVTGTLPTATPAFGPEARVDFRFAPLSWQTAYCFPDDPIKSLVGQRGELRFSRNPATWPGADYPEQVELSFLGMEPDVKVDQRLEAPGIPIVQTRLERPSILATLLAFATNRPDEGRVDNVLLEVAPRSAGAVQVSPVMIVRTKRELKTKGQGTATLVQLDSDSAPLFALIGGAVTGRENTGLAGHLLLRRREATRDHPLRVLFRFPQEGQDYGRLQAGLEAPDQLLDEVRAVWRRWQPFGGPVKWQLNGRSHEFLVACARNIQQAREVKNGQLTFQVGPTCYRGLWVVDGHFILEAARYLGYDAEAQQGLETTWARQGPDGGIFAGGGPAHWKDTGIAMFSLVRQAELSQDWSYFRRKAPDVLRGVEFLRTLCERARNEGGAMGRYGLLSRGFCDGGVGGLRSEFTNTLWVLAGLKAVVEAAERQGVESLAPVKRFYDDLRTASFEAMRREVRRHAAGFDYLPMVMKDDPQWSAADPWDRLRPQGAQWALSHAIYPGLLFERDDPVVRGHIALMQACTVEDVPAETGWIPHEGVWNYNAAFVAHVYLWAGQLDWARRTFAGFLNHASPLYCWREEQPLRGSLVSTYVGDMPHNWASAECILYLRHRLALEDGATLRLLAAIGEAELTAREPAVLTETPTRFGRLSLNLEPVGRRGWQLEFRRGAGPAPARVELPLVLARHRLVGVTGADIRRGPGVVEVAPEATTWTANWKR